MTSIKAIFGLLLAFVAAGAFAVASSAESTGSSPRSGELHVKKECSQYNGAAGSFCTITSSNLNAIKVRSKVFYLEAAGADELDSDLVLYTGPGNAALGHVTLSLTTLSGSIKFRGGAGRFQDFRAHVRVSFDPATNLWRWDGTYRFGHDKD